MITDKKYIEVAKSLNVEVAAIKAVAYVESTGKGFLSDGSPKILFEPHIFWRQLKKHGINPSILLKDSPQLKTILYQKQGTLPYGKVSKQHNKLQRAVSVHREAALESASWGAFQVLGLNWKMLGYSSLQSFINAAYRSEDDHLEMFVRYISINNLVQYIKTKNWAKFAAKYNGKNYKKFGYDVKMAKAYEVFKKQHP